MTHDMHSPANGLALQQLASRLGLSTGYSDAWGHPHQPDETTLKQFLAALGVEAADDGAANEALQRMNEVASAQVIAPVHVVRQSEPAAARLNHGAHALEWELRAEDGSTLRGAVDNDEHGALIRLPAGLPLGYHRLRVADAGAETVLIVCPDTCHQPAGLAAGQRWWGPTVQLYALRSARNWGIGDFTDLMHTLELAAAEGAAVVGINPLHALFPLQPENASPYSPSSRIALNTLYLDVEAIEEFTHCTAARALVKGNDFQQKLQQLRAVPHVDYQGVSEAKQRVLVLLYQHFREHELAHDTPRARLFRSFQDQRPLALRRHALFEAIQAHLHEHDPHVWGWMHWPQAYRDVDSPVVMAFEAEHAAQIEFHDYLQWQCDVQVSRAADRARALGMPLGLYLDVAVGVNEGGSETWALPDLYALGVHVGAPPEPYNPAGQNWGLPPLAPTALREHAYGPFIDLLRANMQHAGALRLDHVMALQRLFWILRGDAADRGTYMAYPFEDMLNVLALESVRQQCLVIGEDLGNVPPHFRETMAARGVRSYCPLYFERTHDGRFPAPHEWRPQALTVVGTHDLPTLRAWWRGDDITTRQTLNLYANDGQRQEQVVARAQERARLLLALEQEGLMPTGASLNPNAIDDADPRLTERVYTYLGRGQSQLVGVQFEDVLQQLEQVNVPSTQEGQYPNWRIKLGTGLEQLAHDARWRAVSAALRSARAGGDTAPDSAAPLPLGTALVPRATYRIQFHAGMRFDDAERAVPYLDALGVSHLYSSPYLKAREGSTHGYDVVDHNALNPEIGDEAAYDRLCSALQQRGMQQLIDIVPNHMGVLEADNAWWLDVLESGEASAHAHTFDVEWHPAAPELQGKVLVPVLGDHYGRVLEAGELEPVFDAATGSFHIAYYKHRFPLDPQTYPEIFAQLPMPWHGLDDEARPAIASLIEAFGRLPPRGTQDANERSARCRDKQLYKRQLAEASQRHAGLQTWIKACLAQLRGTAGQPDSFNALDRLLAAQAYRLAFWRVAGDDVNYRRFFDISTLAALRMERPEVFENTHRTVLRWLGERRVAGLRVDHPDGLADPRGYFERLQARHQQVLRERGLPAQALYVSVEKILAEHEQIPADWPVHGGTGYRYSNQVNGLFVDSRNEAALDQVYQRFIGRTLSFDQVLREAKCLVMSTALASDLQWLTEALYRIAQSDRGTRDFTRNRLRAALAETAAAFPVYRTYISERGVDDTDRQHVAWATAEAKRHSPASDLGAIDFLREVLLGAPTLPDDARRAQALAFVTRWQQFTAPVLAKSMEDTAFYRYHRLISLNDVGGDPRRFGTSVAAFHSANAMRARFLPHTMLGTSTHDSKRSEDVRARIDVLSEIPERWQEAARRWSALNRQRAERTEAVIECNDEYLLYQTLIGIWPLRPVDDASLADLRERIQAYMLKAVREAKHRSNWINPDEAYESALSRFIDQLLGTREPNPFVKDIEAWLQPVAQFGYWNSLNQVVFKLTSPGVPDVYQGSESWNFSIVDPDNRRPVHFDQLQALLTHSLALFDGEQLPAVALHQLRNELEDGRLKMITTARLLALRRAEPELFRDGSYVALEVDGPAAEHVVAYARMQQGSIAVVIGTRLLSTLVQHDPMALGPAVWRGTSVTLPAHDSTRWVDTITGKAVQAEPAGDVANAAANGVGGDGHGGPRRLSLDAAFAHLPFAVLLPQ